MSEDNVPNREPAAVRPILGLGSAIASATSFLGIEPCGACDERADALDELFPFSGSEGSAKIGQDAETVDTGGHA